MSLAVSFGRFGPRHNSRFNDLIQIGRGGEALRMTGHADFAWSLGPQLAHASSPVQSKRLRCAFKRPVGSGYPDDVGTGMSQH